VQELANLQGSEEKAPDQEAGQRALEKLRRVASMESVLVDPSEAAKRQRREGAATEREKASACATEMASLNSDFIELNKEQNAQKRGYGLEKILRELFRINELTYTGSYKTETDQIDGSFVLDAFTYLVEARWRKGLAMDSDIGAFNHKVERRLDATRGVFLSMNGFREEAVSLYQRAKDNRVILVDGQDLSLILNSRFDFIEALQEKIMAASVRGEPYQRLANL